MPVPIQDLVYPERRFGGFTRFDPTVQFCARVQALLGENDIVLDVGCGRGRRVEDHCAFRSALQDLRGQNRTVIGIDVDPGARSNSFIDEFRLIESTVHWPVDDESVDLLYSDFVMEHVERPEEFFAEAARVLKPGGYICLRTPNAWSYISLVSKLVPNRFHARVVAFAQGKRQARDVFPTYYRCNSRRALRRRLEAHGFDACVYSVEADPSYMTFSRTAYRFAAVVHRMLPSPFRSTLLAFAQKRPATSLACNSQQNAGKAA